MTYIGCGPSHREYLVSTPDYVVHFRDPHCVHHLIRTPGSRGSFSILNYRSHGLYNLTCLTWLGIYRSSSAVHVLIICHVVVCIKLSNEQISVGDRLKSTLQYPVTSLESYINHIVIIPYIGVWYIIQQNTFHVVYILIIIKWWQ